MKIKDVVTLKEIAYVAQCYPCAEIRYGSREEQKKEANQLSAERYRDSGTL